MQAQGEHVDSTQKGPAPTRSQTQDSAHDYATITKRMYLGVGYCCDFYVNKQTSSSNKFSFSPGRALTLSSFDLYRLNNLLTQQHSAQEQLLNGSCAEIALPT